MSERSKHAFWEETHQGFAEASEADDLLHPGLSHSEPGVELTETQYLGFNVPEHDIHAVGYLWHHPNLGVVSGGIAVWQGFKSHPLQSEIWDYVTYMGPQVFKDDLRHYRFDNGYEVTTLEALKSHRIQYRNDAIDSWVDVTLEAIAPPVMLDSGMHFEQPMRTMGKIRLRGRDYEVNATTVRDRSFGQLRREYLVPLPPLAWMNAAFKSGFAFGCTAFDDPNRDPEWKGQFELPGGNPLRGGWILKNGRRSRIVEASKTTQRRPGSLFPDQVQLDVVDDAGVSHVIRGQSRGGVNWQTWHNMDSNINLMRWEYEGEVGFGDYQEFLWPEYVRRFHP